MSTKKYYTESYEKYYQEFSGTNVNESATNFSSEVEYLSREFQNVQSVITNWSGEGAQAMSSAALQSVLDKFNTAKKNIDTALLPATEAVEELKKDLETLKLQEETLIELQEQLKIEKAKSIPERIPNGKDKEGKTKYKTNPEYATWQQRIRDLEDEEVKLIEELEKLKKRCDENIKKIALLETNIEDFSNYLVITKAVFDMDAPTSELSFDDRVKVLEQYLMNYQIVINNMSILYNEKYGNGLSLSNGDFENVYMLMDAFELFERAGVSEKEFQELTRKDGNVLLKLDSLMQVMTYCEQNDAIEKISAYINGASWDESVAELYEQDFLNKYNEKAFLKKMQKEYGIENPKEYLKQNKDTILGSWTNLTTSYTECKNMHDVIMVMHNEANDMQKALDLLPYEIHADDPLYQEKYAGMQIDKLTGVDKLFNEHLTQDEKSLYQYLLDTQGKEKAAEYLDAMQDAVNMREGMQNAREYVERIGSDGFQAWDVVSSGKEGFWDGTRNFVDGIKDWVKITETEIGEKSALDYELMFKAQYMLEVADTLDVDLDPNIRKLLNQAYQTGSTVGTMAVPMIVGAVPLPGCRTLSSALMTASFAGNAAVEGRQEGLGVGAACLYGAINGISELAMEKTLGAIPYVRDLENTTGAFDKLLKGTLSEMLEEGLQTGAIENVLGATFFGEELNGLEMLKEGFQAAGQAAISQPFMQGFGKVAGGLGHVAGASAIAIRTTLTTGKPMSLQVYNENLSNTMSTNAETAIANGLETIKEGNTLSLFDKVKLNSDINRATPQEVSAVIDKFTPNQLTELKESGILGKKARENISLAETVSSISKQTGEKLDVSILTKDDLEATVTRDGRNLSYLIADTKASMITNETKQELSEISKTQEKVIEYRINENVQRAQRKVLVDSFIKNPIKNTINNIKTATINTTTMTKEITQESATVLPSTSETVHKEEYIQAPVIEETKLMDESHKQIVPKIEQKEITSDQILTAGGGIATVGLMAVASNAASQAIFNAGIAQTSSSESSDRITTNSAKKSNSITNILQLVSNHTEFKSAIQNNPIVAKKVVDNIINPSVILECLDVNVGENGESKTLLDYAIETNSIIDILQLASNDTVKTVMQNNPTVAKIVVDNIINPSVILECLDVNVGENGESKTLLDYAIETNSIIDILQLVSKFVSKDKEFKSAIQNNPKVAKIVVDNKIETPVILECLDVNVGENGESKTLLDYAIETNSITNILQLISNDTEFKSVIQNNPTVAKIVVDNKINSSVILECLDLNVGENGESKTLLDYAIETNSITNILQLASNDTVKTVMQNNPTVAKIMVDNKINSSVILECLDVNVGENGESKTLLDYAIEKNLITNILQQWASNDTVKTVMQNNPTVAKIMVDNKIKPWVISECLDLNVGENGESKTLLDYAIEKNLIIDILKFVRYNPNFKSAIQNNPTAAKIMVDNKINPSVILECLDVNVGENGESKTLLDYAIETNSIIKILIYERYKEGFKSAIQNNPTVAKIVVDNKINSSVILECLDVNVGENGESKTLLDYAIETNSITNILQWASNDTVKTVMKNNPTVAKIVVDNIINPSIILECLDVNVGENGESKTLLDYAIETNSIIDILISARYSLTFKSAIQNNPTVAKIVVDNKINPSVILECLDVNVGENGESKTLLDYAIETNSIIDILQFASKTVMQNNPTVAKIMVDNKINPSVILECLDVNVGENGESKTLLDYAIETNSITNILQLASNDTVKTVMQNNPTVAKIMVDNKIKPWIILECLDVNIGENGESKTLLDYAIETNSIIDILKLVSKFASEDTKFKSVMQNNPTVAKIVVDNIINPWIILECLDVNVGENGESKTLLDYAIETNSIIEILKLVSNDTVKTVMQNNPTVAKIVVDNEINPLVVSECLDVNVGENGESKTLLDYAIETNIITNILMWASNDTVKTVMQNNPTVAKIVVDNKINSSVILECLDVNVGENGESKTLLDYAIETNSIIEILKRERFSSKFKSAIQNNPTVAKIVVDNKINPSVILECLDVNVGENGESKTLLDYAIEKNLIIDILKFVRDNSNFKSAIQNNPRIAKLVVDNIIKPSIILECLDVNVGENGENKTLLDYAIETDLITDILCLSSNYASEDSINIVTTQEQKTKILQLASTNPTLAAEIVSNNLLTKIINPNIIKITKDSKLHDIVRKYNLEEDIFISDALEYIKTGKENFKSEYSPEIIKEFNGSIQVGLENNSIGRKNIKTINELSAKIENNFGREAAIICLGTYAITGQIDEKYQTLFDFNEFTKNVSQIDVQKYFILCNTTIKIEDRKFVHEKNETETSVFFEQNGNMNNNKYGTDQGIIHSLLQYEKDGKTWSYNKANDIIEKCKEEHKVIPKFYEKFTDEYKKIKNTVMNKYGFNEKDAIIVLTCIDNVAGACTYASLCNSIFDSFKNNQAEFEKAFGFPMYKTENGKKVLNSELLLIDLYIYANTTKNGGKFFVQNQDGTYQVDKTMLDSITDPLGGKILKTDEQIYIYKAYGLNENQVVQKYLEEKGIKINTKLLKFDYENISYKEMKKIINDIKQGMSNGKVYDLGIFTGINMIASTENKYPSTTIGGGHEIHITDISENGFVVSSWGQKYLIPFSDLINNNDWVLVENTITPKQPTINIVDSIDSNYILKNYNEESFLSSLLRIIKSDNISELSLKEKTLFIMCQKRAFEGKINYSELFKNLAKLDGTPFTNEISTAYYDKVANQIKFTSEEKELILKNRDKNKYLVEYIKEKGQLYENLTSTELLQTDEIIYGLEENILDKNLLTREDYQKIFGTDFRSIANALYKDNFTFDELINLAKTNPTISKIVVDNMGIYFLADSLETNILVNGEIKTILDYAIETGKITKIFHSNLGKILDDNATKYPKLAKYLVDRSVYPNSIFENLNMNVGENKTLLEYIIEKGKINVILQYSKLSLDDITKSIIQRPKLVKMLIDNGNISSTLANYLNMNVGENGQSQTLLEYLIATGKKGRLIDILKNSDKNKLQEMIENNPKIAELMISNKLTSYLWDINNISISPNGRLNDFMNKYKISKKTLINKAFECIENGNENLTLDPLLTTDLTIELIKNEFSINELRNILLEEIIDKEQRVLIEKTVQLLQREKLNTDDILYQLKKYALTKKFDSNLEAKLGDSYTNIKENISRQNILMYLKIMNNNISNLNVNIPRNINNIIDDINSISGRNNGVDSLINYIHTGNVELIPDQNGLREEILKLGQQAIQEALIKETIGIDAKNKIDNIINIMTASSDKTTAIENLTIYRITGELIGADDDILQEIESLTENDFAVYFKVYDPTGELKKRLLKNNENNKNTNNKIIQTVNTIKDCISNLKTASQQDYLGAIQQLEQNGVQEKEIIGQLAEIAAHINNRDIQSAMFGFLKRKYPHESDIDTANLVCKYIKNELAKRPRKIKYTDPSTGIKVYAYEDSDPNFVDQCLQAIKTILARVPLLSSEKYYSEITIQDIFNPYDEYWRIKYGYANDFISAATGGDGTVNYYNTTLITHNKEQALEIHLHEIGHNFSKHFTTYVISQSPLWKDAMAADEKINGLTGISTYATETNSSEEDFADSFAYFLMDPSRLNKFPNRKKVLEKLLNGKVKRRKWYERF